MPEKTGSTGKIGSTGKTGSTGKIGNTGKIGTLVRVTRNQNLSSLQQVQRTEKSYSQVDDKGN